MRGSVRCLKSTGPQVHRVHRSTESTGPQIHRSTDPHIHRSTESTGPQSPQSPQVHRSTQSTESTGLQSLGYFPVAWKVALVDPRVKKPCQSASLSNLRPVRNLQFIWKLTERAVYYQTQEHLVQSELYPTFQSAYRAGHSAETA